MIKTPNTQSFACIFGTVLCFVFFGNVNTAGGQTDAKIHRPVRHTSFPAFQGRPQTTSSPDVSADSDPSTKTKSSSAMTAPMVTVCSSLAVVLGLFAALVWITRKYSQRGIGGGQIPSEVVQSLGSTAIDPRTRLTLLRVGHRILVLSQTATGVKPLAEITDPEEVRHLTAVCTGDSKQQFASTLAEVGREPAHGFTGTPQSPTKARQRGRLFATA